jgi:hypothetical protein
MIRTNKKNSPIGRYGPNGIHEISSPTDQLVKVARAIGNQFNQIVRSISDRKLVNKTNNMDGAASEKKASQLVPWTVRFKIILFSVRLRLFSDAKSMQSLKTDIRNLIKSVKKSAPGSNPNSAETSPSCDIADILKKLDNMFSEASSRNTMTAIPLSGERIYNGL